MEEKKYFFLHNFNPLALFVTEGEKEKNNPIADIQDARGAKKKLIFCFFHHQMVQ